MPRSAPLLRTAAAATGAAALAIGLVGCTADEEPEPDPTGPADTSAEVEQPSDEETEAADPLETLAGTWVWNPEAENDMATLTFVIDAEGNVEHTGVDNGEGTLVPGPEDTHQIEITTGAMGEDTWEAVYDAETDTLEIDMRYMAEPTTQTFTRTA